MFIMETMVAKFLVPCCSQLDATWCFLAVSTSALQTKCADADHSRRLPYDVRVSNYNANELSIIMFSDGVMA